METKLFLKSNTFLGLLLSALMLAAQTWDIDWGLINDTAKQTLEGLGLLWALYGRTVADKPLSLTGRPR